jgi:hypothetical protein
MSPWKFIALAAIVIALLSPASSQADLVLAPRLVNEDPSGLSQAFKDEVPWLVLTFSDVDADTVHLNIQAHLSGSEFTTQVNWNVLPSYTSFGFSNITHSGDFVVTSGPSYLLNGFLANGATNGTGTGFDFQVTFATSNTNGGIQRFNLVDVLALDIDCKGSCAGFDEDAFDAFNPKAAKAYYRLDGTQITADQPCAAGAGLCYRVAARIQGLTGGTTNSIWIAGVRPSPTQVAEPSSLVLLGGGLLTVFGLTRRKVRHRI